MSPNSKRFGRRNFIGETLEVKVLLAGDLTANMIEASTTDRIANADIVLRDRPFVAIPGDTREGVGTTLTGGVDGPIGELQELDVVHLGGTPNGRFGSYLVAGVGTGSAAQFSSWLVTGDAPAPTHLSDADPMPGRDFQVHVLGPLHVP